MDSVIYSVTQSWGTGFVGKVTVPGGSAGLKGWTLAFDADFRIADIWGAKIVGREGKTYILTNEHWNFDVASGATASFGFRADRAGGGSTTIQNILLNGADDKPLPDLTVANASVTEGEAGIAKLIFTVSLSDAAVSPVTVRYATLDGTALAGSDYGASAGTLTFAPGQTKATIEVDVFGDTLFEPDEYLTLLLSDAKGADLVVGRATGTIINDDLPPPPVLTIGNATVVEGDPASSGGAASGWLSTSGNQIVDADGTPVRISGVNWFGLGSSNFSPHGLWVRNYKDMIQQIKDEGFNTIRLPYSSELLHTAAAPKGIDFAINPELRGLSGIQILDKIVEHAGEVGLRIILDHHRSDAGAGASENGLWYNSKYTEAAWIADWEALAARYAGNATVIGADLHNEPYAGVWGGGGATDWAAAAERAGNAIGAVNPDWLIFVEGIASYKGDYYWWGGNLEGVRDRPVQLNVPNKLVYSPHDYPNSVFPQSWFSDADFPANMEALFDKHWGFIYREGIAPVYLGEFGTNLVDPKDIPWFDAITAYIGGDFDNDGVSDIPAGHQGISWSFWSWNPNSGETGGILLDDWITVNREKLTYLRPLQYELGAVGQDDTAGAETPVFAELTVTLSEPAAHAVTVHYHTEPGTAGPDDFTPANGTLTFQPGELSKVIRVQVTPDFTVEANERFSVVLTDAIGAVIGNGVGTATIVDDDGASPQPPAEPHPTPEPDTDLDGAFRLNGSWNTGFNASVAIRNDGETVSGWRLELVLDNEIASIWNATIVSRTDRGYIVENAAWNGTVTSGTEVSFGFIGVGQVDVSAVDLFF